MSASADCRACSSNIDHNRSKGTTSPTRPSGAQTASHPASIPVAAFPAVCSSEAGAPPAKTCKIERRDVNATAAATSMCRTSHAAAMPMIAAPSDPALPSVAYVTRTPTDAVAVSSATANSARTRGNLRATTAATAPSKTPRATQAPGLSSNAIPSAPKVKENRHRPRPTVKVTAVSSPTTMPAARSGTAQ